MTRLKNAKAFTLIELIVVIVIIGILVAIAAVAYNSIIAGAKKSALEASASQVAKIVQAKSAAEQTPQDDTLVQGLGGSAGATDPVDAASTFYTDGVQGVTVNTTDANDGLDGDGFYVVKDGFSVFVKYNDITGGALDVAKAVKLG